MTTVEKLKQVFADNFMAYIHAHIAHVNVVGRTFNSDHALLGGIYEDAQGQIDVQAELIRTLDEFMPTNLYEIISTSNIMDYSVEGSADALLQTVLDDQEHIVDAYRELLEIAEDEEHDEIANYAQDRILSVNKQIWMLKSTLE